ncbi:MAG TPA: penicillin-binding transpeptidase domain-containing protein [Blastocatellia bacterium]|nr:penicillin-binding transpeptidase domain-containing protein [Blastocatellia bacterium]
MSIIPELLTLIFVLASLLVMLVLGWAAWRHRNPPAIGADSTLEELKEFGPSATNLWLRGLRVFFMLLILTVLAFHSYWVFRADSNENFTRAKRLDARNRRLAESGLKGWILDRSGKLENALVRYRSDAGVISREYPLGPSGVHLTGYSDFIFGSGGMEFAFRDWLTEPASIKNQILSSNPVGKDLQVSIDINLQREAANLLANQGKGAAAVVLLLPNNEVLAMASAPTFEPRSINDESTWRRISEEAERAPLISPLVNRALGTLVTGGPAFYYRPGSTFKTFIAAVALDTGVMNETFVCKEEGFLPPGSGRPIRDFGGHVHGALGLQDAFKESCNQYFSQLGLKLGRERLENYARRLGYVTSPNDNTRRDLDLWQVLHGDRDDYNNIFAPPAHRLDLSSKATPYDIALQSIGQGFCDQTVLGMALLASVAANPDGSVVSPTFEVNAQRNVAGPFITPQSAAQLRGLMRSVVEGGTASGAMAHLAGRLTSGGKTGTADRDVPVYDSKGKPVVDRVDKDGRTYYKTQGWTDSWYIGFAPADKPVIAFAVVVENGGEGSRAAAPIAAKLMEKAASLGYLGLARPAPGAPRDGGRARPR